jgi:hypothetical protein
MASITLPADGATDQRARWKICGASRRQGEGTRASLPQYSPTPVVAAALLVAPGGFNKTLNAIRPWPLSQRPAAQSFRALSRAKAALAKGAPPIPCPGDPPG